MEPNVGISVNKRHRMRVALLTRFDGSGLIKSRQNLRNTAMGHQQLSGNVARSHTHQGKFDNSLTNMKGKWSSINKKSS